MKTLIICLTLLFTFNSFAFDRCKYIANNIKSTYSAELVLDGENKGEIDKVTFQRISRSEYRYKVTGLNEVGELYTYNASEVLLENTSDNECVMVALGAIENNTIGTIIEGDGMKFFAIKLDDDSLSFIKLEAK